MLGSGAKNSLKPNPWRIARCTGAESSLIFSAGEPEGTVVRSGRVLLERLSTRTFCAMLALRGKMPPSAGSFACACRLVFASEVYAQPSGNGG